MKENLFCFTAVEFPDDPNVVGYFYWYLCMFDCVKEGDKVIAPLGRHNNLQQGIIRKVKFTDENGAPYPLHSIKKITKVLTNSEADSVQNSK